MKIAWVCDNCNWLTVSNSKEHHKMDSCLCGECSVDLEEYMCRYVGSPRTIAKFKDKDKWRFTRK